MPFGSATKETICPLAPPQNQHIFNTHLNYLNIKTVWALNANIDTLLTVVHMQQMSGTDNHYIQEEGCGHEILFVPFGL